MFEHGGSCQQHRLAKGWSHELHTHRQAVVAGAKRHRDGGMAGQIGRDGAHVVEVHGQRIGLGPEGERRGGRGGRQQHVHRLVGGSKIPGDEGTDPLGLAVVGVVVARRQGVGAQHDATLHLGAEPGSTGGGHHLGGGGRIHPQPEAHAVVAGQVAGGLGRGNEVVRRQAIGHRRYRHLHHLGTRSSQGVSRSAHPGGNVSGDAVTVEFCHQSHPQPGHPIAYGGGIRRQLLGNRC